MYLANALIVLAIMALAIPVVLFVAYIIGAATLPPIFNAVNNATPTPAKFQRQKEVFDAWQYIMTHHHNLRGHYIWDVREKYNLTQNEAMLRLISEDCNDMGIQMNYAYASILFILVGPSFIPFQFFPILFGARTLSLLVLPPLLQALCSGVFYTKGKRSGQPLHTLLYPLTSRVLVSCFSAA